VNRQEKRFIRANLGAIFFVAFLGLAGMALPFLIAFGCLLYLGGVALVLETWNGLPDTNQYTQLLDRLFLPIAFVGLIVGMTAGVVLWNRLFVKSGYLDSHTLKRMKLNMAPTDRMERIRKAIGLSFLIPFLIWVNWGIYLRPVLDWWVFLATLPLLFYFVYLAFKEYGSGKR
jgi:hypothetical protein